ncbi:MAG: DUF1822 family protein [Leptolyngbya sp. BL-A-14]
MSDYPMPTQTGLLDYASLPIAAVSLTAAQVDRAIDLSSRVNEPQQWQTYLNALAVFGLEQWLQERAPNLTVNLDDCTAVQPADSPQPVVSNLSVGAFKLCLITNGSAIDAVITVPGAAIEQPDLAAHFYVLLEVAEEQEQVTVLGFVRYDQLTSQLQANRQQPDAEQNYALPLAWFDQEPDQLLLFLRCLEPIAIQLPVGGQEAEGRRQEAGGNLVDSTSEAGANDVSGSRELGVGSWEGMTGDLLQRVTQPAVNAGLWLRDELDQLAQQLSWSLLPPLETASALRSTPAELNAIAAALSRANIVVPRQTRVAYRDVIVDHLSLRLYAVAWSLFDAPSSGETTEQEWTLVLILGAQPDTTLTQPVSLRVSDQTQVLVERILEPATSFVYASVIGSWDEQFIATIDLMNGQALTLQPFAFAPDQTP